MDSDEEDSIRYGSSTEATNCSTTAGDGSFYIDNSITFNEDDEEMEFWRLLPFIGFFLTSWEKIQRWWKKLRNSDLQSEDKREDLEEKEDIKREEVEKELKVIQEDDEEEEDKVQEMVSINTEVVNSL